MSFHDLTDQIREKTSVLMGKLKNKPVLKNHTAGFGRLRLLTEGARPAEKKDENEAPRAPVFSKAGLIAAIRKFTGVRYGLPVIFLICFTAFFTGFTLKYLTSRNNLESSVQYYLSLIRNDLHSSLDGNANGGMTDLYTGVTEFRGIVDFDRGTLIEGLPENRKDGNTDVIRVKGQKRAVAPGVYELRFTEVSAKTGK